MKTYEINLITMKKKAAVPSLNLNSSGKINNDNTMIKSDASGN